MAPAVAGVPSPQSTKAVKSAATSNGFALVKVATIPVKSLPSTPLIGDLHGVNGRVSNDCAVERDGSRHGRTAGGVWRKRS